jgi:hypothetical protein
MPGIGDRHEAVERRFQIYERAEQPLLVDGSKKRQRHVLAVIVADDLFERVQRLAREEKTTFRELTESGLRLVLSGKHRQRSRKLTPLVAFGKGGVSDDFKEWNWDRIRGEIYKGRGA